MEIAEAAKPLGSHENEEQPVIHPCWACGVNIQVPLCGEGMRVAPAFKVIIVCVRASVEPTSWWCSAQETCHTVPR